MLVLLVMSVFCFVYGCGKIHTQHDKHEVVFRIGERRYVAKFSTERSRKNSLFVSLCTCVLECSPKVWETGVQSQVESYQRLKKRYLISPCLTLSIIIFTNPSAQAGYDTRSIFKQSLTGLNIVFSFS